MYKQSLVIGFLAVVLVACGGASAPAATTTVAPTAATATTAVAATMETAGAARDSVYAALPQSVDADGYYVLGNANAPAVMTHYSDLL